ncbi:MAG TPA: endo-1,3-alpha-glucanase family glycosylhydrolase [Acidothermaceae bacterium]|nr:endo-1,3-alpha-glucanase family glycosylhydrolase [Acidothermaceae bacterium]
MRRILTAAGLGVAAVALIALAAPSAYADRPHPKNPLKYPGTVVFQTVPPTPGVEATADNHVAYADAAGVIRLPVDNFKGVRDRIKVPDRQVSANERVHFDHFLGDPDTGYDGHAIQLGLDITRQISWTFTDLQDSPVSPERVTSMKIRSGTGEVITLTGAQLSQPLWVNAGRVKQNLGALRFQDMYWVVDSVQVEGAETVNRAQQKFFPMQKQSWPVQLMFYTIRVRATDFLFGNAAGTGVSIKWPDGSDHYFAFAGDDTSALVASVPRGSYDMKVTGLPMSFVRPAQISRDQTVTIRVATTRDFVAAGSAVVFIALALLAVGRRHTLRRLFAWLWRLLARLARLASRLARWRPRRLRAHRDIAYPVEDGDTVKDGSKVFPCIALLAAGALAALVLPASSARAVSDPSPVAPSASASSAPGLASPVPTLAYYYIWFSDSSWNRAKIDFPMIGRYSSDDKSVMRTQIKQAESAGIDGFLVSWKDTPPLTQRLTELAQVAAEEHFKLGIVYEALDFNRNPLPPGQVGKDLTTFANQFGNNPVFRIFDRPVVVWTGTEKYSTTQLGAVTAPLRSRLLMLASAKSVSDYNRVASLFEGDAYYWSSVNPSSSGYQAKLDDMSNAVHAHHGLWIAPAAPGFDARLVGGHNVISRNNGATFRAELDAARASSPDAVGIISWNEFSENTYIEPSEKYGTQALDLLGSMLHAKPTTGDNPDSSGTSSHKYGGLSGIEAIAVIVGALAILSSAVFAVRHLYVGKHRSPFYR